MSLSLVFSYLGYKSGYEKEEAIDVSRNKRLRLDSRADVFSHEYRKFPNIFTICCLGAKCTEIWIQQFIDLIHSRDEEAFFVLL